MEKFDGQDDFGIWKLRILMQLELQGIHKVLNKEMTKDAKEEEGSRNMTLEQEI